MTTPKGVPWQGFSLSMGETLSFLPDSVDLSALDPRSLSLCNN